MPDSTKNEINLKKTFQTKQLKENLASLCRGSTVVGHLTQSPKFKGSNPTTGTGREREREMAR